MLATLKERLKKIGIEIELSVNYPWVYLDSVNGNRVNEVFCSEYYFCIGFMPIRLGNFQFNDLNEIFKVIRKYV